MRTSVRIAAIALAWSSALAAPALAQSGGYQKSEPGFLASAGNALNSTLTYLSGSAPRSANSPLFGVGQSALTLSNSLSSSNNTGYGVHAASADDCDRLNERIALSMTTRMEESMPTERVSDATKARGLEGILNLPNSADPIAAVTTMVIRKALNEAMDKADNYLEKKISTIRSKASAAIPDKAKPYVQSALQQAQNRGSR